MLLAIFIIALIISAFFTTMEEEDKEESIKIQVQGEIENIDFDDPDEAYEYRETRIQELKAENDLDGSRTERIFHNTLDLITFDFGQTRRFTAGRARGQDISSIIMDYLSYTILLFTTSAILYSFLAILLGLKVAQNIGSKVDKTVTVLGATFSSIPVWWAGLIFLVIFYGTLGWYPRPSPTFPHIQRVGYFGYLRELLIKLSLPLFTIVLVKFGGNLWISRNIVTNILDDDYIMAARAKGVPEKKVIYGHTLKTAAPPITTTVILAILTSLGGCLIAEIIFSWPGIGYLLRRAIHEPLATEPESGVFENQLIAVITFVLVVVSMIGLYITDIICGILDPRVEIGSKFTKEGK